MDAIFRIWYLASAGFLLWYAGWHMGKFHDGWSVVFLCIGLAALALLLLSSKRRRRWWSYVLTLSCVLTTYAIGMALARSDDLHGFNKWMFGSTVKFESYVHPITTFSATASVISLTEDQQNSLSSAYAKLKVFENDLHAELIVAFDKLGPVIIDGNDVTPLSSQPIILSSVQPDNSIVYYNRFGRPQVLTRAIVQDDTMFKLWERLVPGMNLHHWGDVFEGKIYQPSRSFVDLPNDVSEEIGYHFANCHTTTTASDEIRVFDEMTGAFEKKIDLLPVLAQLRGSESSIRERISDCHDPLHFNSVQLVKTQKQASYFPNGKIGDMLLSFRNINTIMLIDKDTLAMKWYVSAAFNRQHDPNITDHGTILVFDNKGSTPENGRSRVVEIDIASRKTVGMWEASGEDFFDSDIRGKILIADEGKLIVQEEYPANPSRPASMFMLTCPGPYVSMECQKSLIFKGEAAKFVYANAGLIQSY